jgi:hypothetical protein
MTIAVVTTLVTHFPMVIVATAATSGTGTDIAQPDVVAMIEILAAIGVGAVIGLVTARRIKMIDMPQLVGDDQGRSSGWISPALWPTVAARRRREQPSVPLPSSDRGEASCSIGSGRKAISEETRRTGGRGRLRVWTVVGEMRLGRRRTEVAGDLAAWRRRGSSVGGRETREGWVWPPRGAVASCSWTPRNRKRQKWTFCGTPKGGAVLQETS